LYILLFYFFVYYFKLSYRPEGRRKVDSEQEDGNG
jgi:hypothetical protein